MFFLPFLACLYEGTESYRFHFDIDITLESFMSKFFYVMGKALSDLLFCTGTGIVTVGSNFCDFLFASLDEIGVNF